MSKHSRLKIALLVAVFVTPILVLGLAAAYRSLTKELDEKFYASIDSVPTRVFSAVFWLRPGVGFSLDELHYRLQERDYREMPTAPAAPGQFHIDASADAQDLDVTLFLNAFDYPAPAKELFFTSAGVLGEHAQLVHFHWHAGEITKVSDASGAEVNAIALEPVLVAQLNSSSIESRKAVTLEQIPHTLLKAIVLVEDQRFLEHSGIDPRGILRSMYVNLRSGSYQQGASTITQQLIRNIYLSRQKTISRKLMEMVMAVMLEWRFSKDQILQKYLNEVYFGQAGNIAIHGVSQAAKFYFNKPLDDLTISEQAFIGAIVRGPIYYSPFRHYDRAKQRQELVLKKMLEGGIITDAQYKHALKEELKFAKSSPVQDRAPYFTDMVKAQLSKDLQEQEVIGLGYQVFSTLDTYYQSLAEKTISRNIAALEDRFKQATKNKKKKSDKNQPELEPSKNLQGIFMALDPSTGHLLAMVGGRSYVESNYNRALLMRRQVGSLFKPFVYLAALINGVMDNGGPMNAVTKMEDKPFTYEYDGQTWSPKNYENEFMGTVTLRFALANSINTVAAQLAIKIGLDKVVEVAHAAGIETPLQALPSIALGAVGLAPIEVLTAYNTLVNWGMKREITSTLLVVDEDGRAVAHFLPKEEQVLPAAETANLVDMMRSVFTIGTARLVAHDQNFQIPAAGKTGTTNEFRDAWFTGFTSKVSALAWVGFDRDDALSKKERNVLRLTGAVGALPAWMEFVRAVHKDQPAHDFAVPDGLLRKMRVDLISGGQANARCDANAVDEVFTYKNAPHTECP